MVVNPMTVTGTAMAGLSVTQAGQVIQWLGDVWIHISIPEPIAMDLAAIGAIAVHALYNLIQAKRGGPAVIPVKVASNG